MGKKQSPGLRPIKPAPGPSQKPVVKPPPNYRTPTISRRPIRQPGR